MNRELFLGVIGIVWGCVALYWASLGARRKKLD